MGKGRAVHSHLGGELEYGVCLPLKAHGLPMAVVGDGEGPVAGLPNRAVPKLDVIYSDSC